MKLKVLLVFLLVVLVACSPNTQPQVIVVTATPEEGAPVAETVIVGEAPTAEIQPTVENTPEPTIDPTVTAKCSTGGGGIIRLGQIVTGEITDVNCFDSWSFAAKKGDYLIITLNASSGLDGALYFYKGMTVITSNDDLNNLDASLTIEIPEDGEDYSISVERHDGENGTTVGVYALFFALGRPDGTPIATVNVDTICRFGPSVNFPKLGGLVVGDSALVVAKGEGGEYWVIENPEDDGNCWIYGGYATVTGNVEYLPTLRVPIYLDIQILSDPAISGQCFFKINGIGVPDSDFNLQVRGSDDGGTWKSFKTRGNIFVPSSAKDNEWKFSMFPFGVDSMKIGYKQLLTNVLVEKDEVGKIFSEVPGSCQ